MSIPNTIGLPTQMQVKDYAQKYVSPLYSKKFYALMRKWDGRADVAGAFYTIGVLQDQHRYAITDKSY